MSTGVAPQTPASPADLARTEQAVGGSHDPLQDYLRSGGAEDVLKRQYGFRRAPVIVTALPANPGEGDEAFLQLSPAVASNPPVIAYMKFIGGQWAAIGREKAPACRVQLAAPQAITGGTFTAITWPAIADASFGRIAFAWAGTAPGGLRWHDGAGTSFVFPWGGLYRVSCRIIWAANAAGHRRMSCQIGGSGEFVLGSNAYPVQLGTGFTETNDSDIVRVNAGESISCTVYQDGVAGPGTLNVIPQETGMGQWTTFSAAWLGP